MKKTFYIIGGTAVGLLVVGVILFILAGWGSLVEYHAFEWRGVGPTGGASPRWYALCPACRIICATVTGISGKGFGMLTVPLSQGCQRIAR